LQCYNLDAEDEDFNYAIMNYVNDRSRSESPNKARSRTSYVQTPPKLKLRQSSYEEAKDKFSSEEFNNYLD